MPDAENNLILPFTRFLCGPADYTVGRVLNTRTVTSETILVAHMASNGGHAVFLSIQK